MRRISAALTLLVSVAATATVLTLGSPAVGSSAPAHYRYLEAQVFTASGLGSVAVGMPNPRTVKIQHLDPATGTWDSPTVLYRKRGVTCGKIEGRASAGGVALLLACDTPYYVEDVPAHSVGLVSRDLRGWSRTRLPGEAYKAPAISPTGRYAAWLAGGSGRYVQWSAEAGFAPAAATTNDFDSGGETLVVDDAGTVSVLGPESRGRDCVVGVHTRELTGALTHTVVEGVDPGCTEGSLENVDALTVTGGQDRASRYTLTRTDVGAPWRLTRIRPVDAPGLVKYGYTRKRIPNHYLETTDPAQPLVTVGSPDRHHIYVQRYDDATQTWGSQVLVHTSGKRCADAYDYTLDGRALYVDELRCRGTATVLVSADAIAWTVGRIGRRPWTATETAVALPGAGATQVVTTAGAQQFPAAIDGPCDVAVPGRPGELVRLHGGRGWPTKVQVSTGEAFKTVSTGRRLRDTCRRVLVDNASARPVVLLQGRRDHYARLRLRDGTWTVTYAKRPVYLRADS